MNNVFLKNRDLATSIRANKCDTPTNIDISALQATAQVPIQPHRNSLKNNRYQKGSHNIVNSELSLLSTGENTLDNNTFRTFSIGNNSSHSTKGGSDATPSSNPSSVSNYNVNRSDSNTPETSISASESALDAVLESDNYKPNAPDAVHEENSTNVLKPSRSKGESSISSHNSSFASADEYPSEDKLTWDTSIEENCSTVNIITNDIRELGTKQDLSSSDTETTLEKKQTNQTGYSTGSSGKTVTPNSEKDIVEDAFQTNPPTSSEKKANKGLRKLEPSAEFFDNAQGESSCSSESHKLTESNPSITSSISQKSLCHSKDLGYDSDRTITKPESKRASNLSPAICDQSPIVQDENPATMLVLKQPQVPLNQRRNPGLTLNLGAVRNSFVDFPTSIGTPASQTSLPSVLKSPDGDFKSPLVRKVSNSIVGLESSPGNRMSIYSPVQIEKFLTDNQEEVPPRGDIVMMEVHKRNLSVSSYGSVLPSPIILQTKSTSANSQKEIAESESILKNRLSMLGVVNVDFDKSLPSSPAIENVNQKWTQEELNKAEKVSKTEMVNAKQVTSAQAEKSDKTKSGFRKVFKMFSKTSDSQNKPNPKTEILHGEAAGKKKFLNIPLMLNSRLSPTYSVRERKPITPEHVFEVPISPPEKQSYDLPALDFEEIFFKDVLVKFDEVEQQAQNEVDQLKRNNSLHNVFLKDDELSRDQIANQQQKDAGNSDEFLPIDERSRLEGVYRFYETETHSEEILFELPVIGEQLIVLSKSDIAAILERPHTLTYLFLRFLRQYRDSPEVTVCLTGFDPMEVKEIKHKNNQRSIIGQKRASSLKNRVKFADTVHISETFDPDMYKRYNRSVTQYYLTEFAEVNRIKNELNFYKCHEMLVHAKSQCNTHFFY